MRSGTSFLGQPIAFAANTVLAFEANVSVEYRKASIRIDGTPVASDWDIPLDTSRGIGRLYVGSLNNAGTADDVMRMDNLRVVACEAPLFADCLLSSGFEN